MGEDRELAALAKVVTHEVAFFFKQWGGKNKKKAGRMLDGRTWDEMPIALTPTRAPLTARARSLPVVA